MAAEMTLFKLAFNGEVYKFKCASTGEALFNSIMAKVKSIVKEDDPKLCWKDDDSNLVLASESDLEAAIDWAMVTRKNPAKAPCVHLVVEETQSHPTPAAVQQEAEVAAAAEHAAARLILATPEETPAVVAKAAEQLQMDIMKSKFEDLKVAAAAAPAAETQPIETAQLLQFVDALAQGLINQSVSKAAQDDSEDLGEVTAEEWEESETGEEDCDEDEEESETETAIEPSEDEEEEEESDSDSDDSDSDEEETDEEETDEEETESEDTDEEEEEDDVSDDEENTEEEKAVQHIETVQLQQTAPAVENKVPNDFSARERDLKIRAKEIEIKEDAFMRRMAEFAVKMEEFEEKIKALNDRVEEIEEAKENGDLEKRMEEMEERMKKDEKRVDDMDIVYL